MAKVYTLSWESEGKKFKAKVSEEEHKEFELRLLALRKPLIENEDALLENLFKNILKFDEDAKKKGYLDSEDLPKSLEFHLRVNKEDIILRLVLARIYYLRGDWERCDEKVIKRFSGPLPEAITFWRIEGDLLRKMGYLLEAASKYQLYVTGKEGYPLEVEKEVLEFYRKVYSSLDNIESLDNEKLRLHERIRAINDPTLEQDYQNAIETPFKEMEGLKKKLLGSTDKGEAMAEGELDELLNKISAITLSLKSLETQISSSENLQKNREKDAIVKKLFEVQNEVIEAFKDDKRPEWSQYLELRGDVYKAAEEKLNEVKFNAHDLNEYLKAGEDVALPKFQTFKGLDEKNAEIVKKAIVRGIFTGYLAHLLYSRGNSDIRIDMEWKTYPYLFYYAKEVGNLFVKNVKGYSVCSEIASEGKAENIILMNVEGEYAGSHIGSRGEVGSVCVLNVKGDNAGRGIGFGGKIGNVYVMNVEGNSAGEGIGGNEIKSVCLVNIKGNRAGFGIGMNSNSNADDVCLVNIEGNDTGMYIGQGGEVKNLIGPGALAVSYKVKKPEFIGNIWDGFKEVAGSLEKANSFNEAQKGIQKIDHIIGEWKDETQKRAQAKKEEEKRKEEAKIDKEAEGLANRLIALNGKPVLEILEEVKGIIDDVLRGKNAEIGIKMLDKIFQKAQPTFTVQEREISITGARLDESTSQQLIVKANGKDSTMTINEFLELVNKYALEEKKYSRRRFMALFGLGVAGAAIGGWALWNKYLKPASIKKEPSASTSTSTTIPPTTGRPTEVKAAPEMPIRIHPDLINEDTGDFIPRWGIERPHDKHDYGVERLEIESKILERTSNIDKLLGLDPIFEKEFEKWTLSKDVKSTLPKLKAKEILKILQLSVAQMVTNVVEGTESLAQCLDDGVFDCDLAAFMYSHLVYYINRQYSIGIPLYLQLFADHAMFVFDDKGHKPFIVEPVFTLGGDAKGGKNNFYDSGAEWVYAKNSQEFIDDNIRESGKTREEVIEIMASVFEPDQRQTPAQITAVVYSSIANYLNQKIGTAKISIKLTDISEIIIKKAGVFSEKIDEIEGVYNRVYSKIKKIDGTGLNDVSMTPEKHELYKIGIVGNVSLHVTIIAGIYVIKKDYNSARKWAETFFEDFKITNNDFNSILDFKPLRTILLFQVIKNGGEISEHQGRKIRKMKIKFADKTVDAPVLAE